MNKNFNIFYFLKVTFSSIALYYDSLQNFVTKINLINYNFFLKNLKQILNIFFKSLILKKILVVVNEIKYNLY